MNVDLQIRKGLEFKCHTLFLEKENCFFVRKSYNRISLICEFSGLDCNLKIDKAQISYSFEFIFHHEYLMDFSPERIFDLNLFPDQKNEICCNTQMILFEIINCKLQGVFRNMFLESKALSLLICFQKCNLSNAIDCGTCKFLTKQIEKDKIMLAKEIILKKLNNPPTIPELSIQIGINQCYLKRGFKEIFGITIYDFVQEQRMQKAMLLLKSTDFTVSQVAEQIGFSSLSNFSAAFKRLTGVFPSEIQQN